MTNDNSYQTWLQSALNVYSSIATAESYDALAYAQMHVASLEYRKAELPSEENHVAKIHIRNMNLLIDSKAKLIRMEQSQELETEIEQLNKLLTPLNIHIKTN